MSKLGCKHIIIFNWLWMSGSAGTRPRYVGCRRKQFQPNSCWIARESCFESLWGLKSIGIPSRLSHGSTRDDSETLLIKQRTLEWKYSRLLRNYNDISREYKDVRNALNALTNTRDGAEMVTQHLLEAPAGGATAAGPASSRGLTSWRIRFSNRSWWRARRSTGQRTAGQELPALLPHSAPAPPDQGWRNSSRTLADECVYGQWNASVDMKLLLKRNPNGIGTARNLPILGPVQGNWNMHLICNCIPKYAQNMPSHRLEHRKYADYMHEICIYMLKYAFNMHSICITYAVNMQ